MAREKAVYVCEVCGQVAPKWQGRCHACGSWNSFALRSPAVDEAPVRPSRKLLSAWQDAQAAAGASAAWESTSLPASAAAPTALTAGPASIEGLRSLSQCIGAVEPRWPTGIPELDRVLGGGIVPGSVVLLGGEPGIGKSTLLLQAGNQLALQGHGVLYVAGEESAPQIGSRAERLGARADRFFLLNRNSLTDVFVATGRLKPDLLLVDSLQTVFNPELEAPPGSLAQVRQVAVDLLALAKGGGPTIILVGHVTKSGLLAGPKVIEHIVDVVLSFEGERRSSLRLLRAVKNRFGSTQEVGILEMGEQGLASVIDPSQVFLGERPVDAPGSVVLATTEGYRPVLVEVQALVTAAPFGGTPRRLMTGIDPARAAMVLAVLEKRAGLNLMATDVYVNVAGGLPVEEPAADLAVALAVASSLRGVPVPADLVVAGEVGLTGEVRSVNLAEQRVAEAARAGFRRMLLPAGNARRLALRADLEVEPVSKVEEALAWVAA